MTNVHQNLLRALMNLRTGSVSTALGEIGFKARTKKPSVHYDSFCQTHGSKEVQLSYGGKIARLWIYHENVDIPIDELPRDPHDMVLVVRNAGNALTLARNIFTPQLLKTESSVGAELPHLRVIMKPYVQLSPNIASDDTTLTTVFGNEPPIVQAQYFSSYTEKFLTRIVDGDIKSWIEIGFGPIDKEIVVQMVEAFMSAGASGPVHIPFALTGECAFGLRALGWKDRIICHEPHPICATAIRKECELVGLTEKIMVFESNPMAPCADIYNGTAKPFACVLGRFPYVTAKSYKKGYPKTQLSEAMPTTQLPHMRETACVASAMLIRYIVSLAQGGIGTFVVPENFTVNLSEGSSRLSILMAAEILSVVPASGPYKILTVRRIETLKLTSIDATSRPPVTSGEHVRWIGAVPCFVDDVTVPGMRAGETPDSVLGSLITSIEILNSSRAEPGEISNIQKPGMIPLRGHGDSYILRTDPAILAVDGATLFVHRPISENGVVVAPHDGSPVAIGTATAAIRTQHPERVRQILESPSTLKWLLNILSTNSISRRFTEDLLMSIPL